MIVDYHMHLRAPSEAIDHSPAAAERFVEAARERGVDEIGFTEHVYYFGETRHLWSLPYQLDRCVYDLDRYCGAVLEAKARGLPVKLGLEVDFLPGREEELAESLRGYPWDFLLGSVHWIDGDAVDQEPGIWARLGIEAVWRLYFEHLAQAARSGLFDVLSHPDLVKIFGRRPSAQIVGSLHRDAAAAIGAADVCVEISTAGWRTPVGELYPDPSFLADLRRHGVPVTVGSDAHVPADVGRDFDRALAVAREGGYETVSVFDGRRRRQEKLG